MPLLFIAVDNMMCFRPVIMTSHPVDTARMRSRLDCCGVDVSMLYVVHKKRGTLYLAVILADIFIFIHHDGSAVLSLSLSPPLFVTMPFY